MLFCGTLYLKALAGWDGAVRLAPFGGVSFMAGWLVIVLDYCRPAAGGQIADATSPRARPRG